MAKEKKQSEISTVRRAKHGGILTVIFAIVSFLWISPILIVFLNSFKRKAYIFTHPFSPSANSLLEGWDKFVSGIGRATVFVKRISGDVLEIHFLLQLDRLHSLFCAVP